MDNLTKMSLKELMSNLTVESLLTGHSHVASTWRDMDYVPDYNKLYFIKSGTGEIIVDGKIYSPQAGEVMLMPAGVIQSYYSTDARNTYLKYWFHFSAKVGDIDLFNLIRTPLCVKVPDCKHLTDLFDELLYYDSHQDVFYNVAMTNAYAMQIVCYFLGIVPDDKIHIANSSDIIRLLPVASYIEENLDKDISVEKLADIACLQPNYFINFFHKYMGQTPIKYVNKARMNKAVELLQRTDMKISEIASKCGFQSEMYFSKAFKKNFDITPRDYRRLNNQ